MLDLFCLLFSICSVGKYKPPLTPQDSKNTEENAIIAILLINFCLSLLFIIMSNSLSYTEIKPTESPNAAVIFLHGLGASAQELLSIVPNLKLPSSTYFVFPQAPQRPITINQNMVMSGWYDIFEMKKYSKEDEQGILASNILIQELINKIESYVPAKKIFLAGFSQGGAMAMYSGLTYANKIGGIACLSGYLPINKKFSSSLLQSNKNTSIFMAHGTFDSIVPMEYGLISRQFLEQLGHKISWHEYPIEHHISSQQLNDLGGWLIKLINTSL